MRHLKVGATPDQILPRYSQMKGKESDGSDVSDGLLMAVVQRVQMIQIDQS